MIDLKSYWHWVSEPGNTADLEVCATCETLNDRGQFHSPSPGWHVPVPVHLGPPASNSLDLPDCNAVPRARRGAATTRPRRHQPARLPRAAIRAHRFIRYDGSRLVGGESPRPARLDYRWTCRR